MARVRIVLAAATPAIGLLVSLTPAYAATPPTTVTALSAKPGSGVVLLSWTNPADADFKDVVVREQAGSTPPSTVTDGQPVYTGVGTHVLATGLTNGASYAFAVFTRNTADDVSDPAVIQATPVPAPATKLTLTVAPKVAVYGSKPLLTVTMREANTGTGVPGAPVYLWRKPYGASTWTKVYQVTTNSSGVATHLTQPGVNTYWYASHVADPWAGGSSSPVITSYVKPVLKVTRSPLTVPQNVASIVTATVWPSHAGQPVLLQRYYSGAWHGSKQAALNGNSVVVFNVATSEIGTRVYRVVKPADADHAQAVYPSFGITTVRRTLTAGMSGADVKAVQARLIALHYDPASTGGYYDYDTVHAVAAFQKTNLLPVTGNVDPTTYAKLWTPRAPLVRHPQSGSWIEVDITRQTLVYGRDGKVLRIIDVSTGSGKYFTVDGVTQKAVTPTGSFHIFHKIDGMRVSRLGELWRPAYFASGGYAIHGNGSVPFYPASHGCVRITNSAMNRLFSMLYIGMPVYVYRS